MKNKTAFVTLVVFCLVVLALISRNGDILLMIVPLLVYLGVGIYFAPGEISLSAVRLVDGRVDENRKAVEVSVQLTNVGVPLYNVLLRDAHFPNTELLFGKYEKRTAIPEMGEANMHYAFKAQRGYFSWESIGVFASDPFGLVEVRKEIPARAEILIEPEYEKLNHIPVRPDNTLHSAGLVPARRAGSGLNFWGVREYHLGDSLRWLNWKTIARHPRHMYTTEFEHEEIMDVGLILDARLQTEVQFGKESLFGCSVSATMSLAELFLREGNRVGLLVFGQHMTPLQPGYGKKQLHRISTALASANAKSNFSLIYLEYVQKRLFSNRALIVIISSLALNDLQTYKQLRAYGYQIVLVSPDPVNFTILHSPPDSVLDLALRAARIERYAHLKQLLRLGVKVIDWQVERSLNETLHTIFSNNSNGKLYV